MECVYHIRRDFRGTVLLPLHALADEHPGAYRAALAKYAGREWLVEYVVPLLGVRWNDVVHCSPVPPRLLYAALRRAGAAPPPLEWFRVPAAALPADRTLWFANAAGPAHPGALPDDAEFAPFDPARYRELDRLPPRAEAGYREEVRQGRRPLLFYNLPHVLVAGPIDVAGAEVIEWSRPPP